MKLSYLFLLLSVLLNTSTVNAQGLFFQNPFNSIRKRTSYDVFKEDNDIFHHQFTINFEMRLPENPDIGYILRITDLKSDEIFNVFLDESKEDIIELNREGYKELITFKYNRCELKDEHWFQFSLHFDLDNKIISMKINGHKKTIHDALLPKEIRPDLVFGRNDYIIDVPAFGIKDLKISGDSKVYYFPLNQSYGNNVYDKDGKTIGYVENPYWGINDSYHWKFLKKLHSNTNAGVCFDPFRQNIYYYNRTELNTYNISSKQSIYNRFANRCPVEIYLGMNFFNPINNRLYTYEVHKNNIKPQDVTLASLNLSTLSWTPESNNQLKAQEHHHGSFFDWRRQELTIYGGFEPMHYSNQFYTYDLHSHSWSVMKGIKGPRMPRYFVSVGQYGNDVYLFGGMGNESGNQSVGRKYFYDLYRLNKITKKITKLWDLKWGKKQNVVPVRNMIIFDRRYFYTLCYSEFLSDSYLKLYRFSIKDGSYQILGDSIPIHSDKITTNANLYYDRQQRKFIVTVQESKDDISSTLKIYSIDLPVLSATEYAAIIKPPHSTKKEMIILIICILCIGVVFIFLYRKKNKAGLIRQSSRLHLDKSQLKPNSIYLFGDFMARDRKNRDISYMFTNKLREVLFILIDHSEKEGISSKVLGTMLWGNKTTEKIKNSRSVTINHLRKVLEEIDGIQVVYQDGFFKLDVQAPFYCDYYDCSRIIKDDNANDFTLLSILKRGKFLQKMDMPTLDRFKSKEEQMLIPILTKEMEEAYKKKEYEIAIEWAKAIFNADPLNTNALDIQIKSLKRLSRMFEAKDAIRAFNREYQKDFGENYEYKSND
nr:DNA-binding transcriptional activator [uncultured Prevotella sp.]